MGENKMIIQFGENSVEKIRLMIRANQLRQQGEYSRAATIYQDVITQFGETAELSGVLAYCYFQSGLYQGSETLFQEAISWIKKAIALAPMVSQFYDILGEIYSLGTLDYQEAARAYKMAIELDLLNVHALVSASSLYGLPDDVVTLDEAIVWLKRAVQLEPSDPIKHVNLGLLYHEANLFLEAKNEWLMSLSCPQPLDASVSNTISKLLGDRSSSSI